MKKNVYHPFEGKNPGLLLLNRIFILMIYFLLQKDTEDTACSCD